MTARALLVTVHTALVETNGQEAVWDLFAEPDPRAQSYERSAAVIGLGGELA